MRCKPLTETSAKKTDPEGRERLVSAYEWRGHAVEVCDSARNVLSIIRMFDGGTADVGERLLGMLFLDPMALPVADDEELQALVYDAMWDVCGLDVTPDGRFVQDDDERWFDWDEDADRIRNSLRAAYGICWDDVSDSMTFSEASSLITQLAEYGVETPFQQAVHYRLAKPPSAKEVGQRAVDAFYEMRDFYELKDSGGSFGDQGDVDAMFEAA